MTGQGATTLWETWRESDNTYSNCHPMFGSISEWFYRWLGGIRPDTLHPGFQRFYLEPQTPDGLSYVKTSYKTPYGYIVSDWEKDEPGTIVYHLTIPRESTALFRIPAGENDQIEILNGPDRIQPDEPVPGKGFLQMTLPGGDYTITKKRLY